MTNADLFRTVFGMYASELWAMPEPKFLEWLNEEQEPTGNICDSCCNTGCIFDIRSKIQKCDFYKPQVLKYQDAKYREGWNDAMQYIFVGGKGYSPFDGKHEDSTWLKEN